MSKKYEHLAPHERKVLKNEFYRERMIQDRLSDAIYWTMLRKTLKSMGGIHNVKRIHQELKETGLTSEIAAKMDNKEFEKYMKKHNISI